MCNFEAGLYFQAMLLPGVPSLYRFNKSTFLFVTESNLNNGLTAFGNFTEGSNMDVIHFNLADSISSSANNSKRGIASGMSL